VMAIADNGSRSGNPGPDGEGPSAGDNEAHQVNCSSIKTSTTGQSARLHTAR